MPHDGPAGDDGAERVIARAREVLVEAGEVPLPGAGRTADRWGMLIDVATEDLSLARIVEGHLDAVAILAELDGSAATSGELLGVWAARPEALIAQPTAGGWVLDGTKPFCSGSTLLDTVLVAAASSSGHLLLRVGTSGLSAVPGTWSPLGMAATRSETMVFDDVVVAGDAVIGGPGDYVGRPGFGHGGCGVAACWWGGGAALLADLRNAAADRPDDMALADLARAAMAVAGAGHALRAAAATIDEAPLDADVALLAAASTRVAVAEAARTVVAAAGRHLGTSVLGVDRSVTGRVADLTTYLTQHREATAADLGRRLLHEPGIRW